MLNEEIEVLGLPGDLCTLLKSKNINTVYDLINNYQSGKLKQIRGIGAKKIEIINYVLNKKYGLTVKDETNKELRDFGFSEKTITQLNIHGIKTIDDVKSLSINNQYGNTLNTNTKFATETITKMHAKGHLFKDEQNRSLPKESSIDKLDFYPYVISNMKRNGILTIQDLLNFPTDLNIEKSFLTIRGLGPTKLKELINVLKSHNLEFTYLKSIYLESEFAKLEEEQINLIFCLEINTLEDFKTNTSILNLIKSIKDNCPDYINLTTKDTVDFLLTKVLISKNVLLQMSKSIEEGLKLK